MTLPEFINETSRIENYYEKELNPAQRTEWYEQLKNLTQERYRQIIYNLFSKNKYMPKLSEILEINKQIGSEAKEIKSVQCEKCKGTGRIIYTKIVNDNYPAQYAARCDCENGRRYMSYPTMQEVGLE